MSSETGGSAANSGSSSIWIFNASAIYWNVPRGLASGTSAPLVSFHRLAQVPCPGAHTGEVIDPLRHIHQSQVGTRAYGGTNGCAPLAGTRPHFMIKEC